MQRSHKHNQKEKFLNYINNCFPLKYSIREPNATTSDEPEDKRKSKSIFRDSLKRVHRAMPSFQKSHHRASNESSHSQMTSNQVSSSSVSTVTTEVFSIPSGTFENFSFSNPDFNNGFKGFSEQNQIQMTRTFLPISQTNSFVSN